ncbi:MAG: PQQ-dependent sugar dehydrogenase [Parvularculaceae bacterium]
MINCISIYSTRIKCATFLIIAFGVVAFSTSAFAGTITLDRIIPRGGDFRFALNMDAPTGDDRLFFSDIDGNIRIYDPTTGQVLATPYLTIPGVSLIGEQGFLGMTFAPDYHVAGSAGEGRVYVSYVDTNETHRVVEYQVDPSNPNQIAGAGRDIISIPHPNDGTQNHYGGWIGFSPVDGHLYITTGDSDADIQVTTAQDRSDLLGVVIRIDPFSDDFPTDGGRNYGIPTDNPYVGQGPGEEAYSTGLRNPYRGSFDPTSGELLIGDVGEDRREEIDIVSARANFGWAGFEGSEEFDINLLTGDTTNVVAPLYDYGHGSGPFTGISVVGGEVYNGGDPALAALQGQYVFADLGRSVIWSFEIDYGTGTISNLTEWALQVAGGGEIPDFIVAFGTDNAGNLYMSTLFDGIFQLTAASEVPLPAAFWMMACGLGLISRRARKSA